MKKIREVDEWLDQRCWSCGSVEVGHPDEAGWLLCDPCRFEELFRSPSTPTGQDRWRAEPLNWCWRCLGQPVAPWDDLGLCQKCLDILKAG